MHTLIHNQYGYRFLLNSYFTTIQGEANAEGASEKLKEICAAAIGFDAVVIIRGGGADADFLLFDQYVLCAAVAGLPIPVITGIGHLKNQTLVDLLAHTATKTPTKAAEFIVAHNRAFEERVLSEQQRIIIKSQQVLQKHASTLHSQNAHLARSGRALLQTRKEEGERVREKVVRQSKQLLHEQKLGLSDAANKALLKPQLLLAKELKDIERLAGSMKGQAVRCISNQKSSIAYYEGMCRMMSPVNLLRKGFALVYQQGKIITEGSALSEGDRITVRLWDSAVEATIQQKQSTDGDAFNI